MDTLKLGHTSFVGLRAAPVKTLQKCHKVVFESPCWREFVGSKKEKEGNTSLN